MHYVDDCPGKPVVPLNGPKMFVGKGLVGSYTLQNGSHARETMAPGLPFITLLQLVVEPGQKGIASHTLGYNSYVSLLT